MKTSAPKTIDGVTYSRVQFFRVKTGDSLYQMRGSSGQTPTLLGAVESVERIGENTVAATLDNGKRITARGWQNKRLWKIA